MKKILIVCFSNLKRDPRVFRQINYLKDHYDVSTVGLNDPEIPGVDFYKCERKSTLQKILKLFFMLIRKHERAFWRKPECRVYESVKDIDFELVIANDIYAMPFAVRLKKEARIIFDAHEYYPEYGSKNIIWNLFFKNYNKYLCDRYIKDCDIMTTISSGIADEYKNKFDIEPEIINNAPEMCSMKPNEVNENEIKIIHHGVAGRLRRIELLIEMMDYLDDRFRLYLMLIPETENYFNRLKRKAAGNRKIIFIKPVDMRDIVEVINKFDIGIMLFEPLTFNLKYTLPNKFFEFIQARLMIASGPSYEIEKIVKKHDCGIISADFKPENMASELIKLDKHKIGYYKSNSDKIASEFSSSVNMKKLESMIMNLIGK